MFLSFRLVIDKLSSNFFWEFVDGMLEISKLREFVINILFTALTDIPSWKLFTPFIPHSIKLAKHFVCQIETNYLQFKIISRLDVRRVSRHGHESYWRYRHSCQMCRTFFHVCARHTKTFALIFFWMFCQEKLLFRDPFTVFRRRRRRKGKIELAPAFLCWKNLALIIRQQRNRNWVDGKFIPRLRNNLGNDLVSFIKQRRKSTGKPFFLSRPLQLRRNWSTVAATATRARVAQKKINYHFSALFFFAFHYSYRGWGEEVEENYRESRNGWQQQKRDIKALQPKRNWVHWYQRGVMDVEAMAVGQTFSFLCCFHLSKFPLVLPFLFIVPFIMV